MKILAEFDETTYGLLCEVKEVKPLLEALGRLYRTIWVEACYDAYNDETRTITRKLLEDIQFVNSILKFHK